MSPQASMVARASLDWDQEIYFPRPNYDDDLAVAPVVGDTRYLQKAGASYDRATTQALHGSSAIVGTGQFRVDASMAGGLAGAAGYPRIRTAATAVPPDMAILGFEGLAGVLPTLSPGPPIAAGASYPSISRVWWLQMLVEYRDTGVGVATNEQGVTVAPQDQAIHAWPTEAFGGSNRGGMGLVGDGAGNWIYRSFDRAGAPLIRESVALPAHNYFHQNLAEWVIVGARPGIAAVFEFWFNGTLIAHRNWAGALLEPIGGVVPVNVGEWRWTPSVKAEGQSAVLVSGVMRAGRFLRDGTEIQG